MLYRWPQGRIIRTITIVIAVLIAFDLGRSSYEQWSGYIGDRAVPFLIYGILLGVLALGVLISGIALAGFHPRSAQFLIDVEREMVKVDWPNRQNVLRSTVVIAIMTVILSVFIFLVDIMNKALVYDGLFELFEGAS